MQVDGADRTADHGVLDRSEPVGFPVRGFLDVGAHGLSAQHLKESFDDETAAEGFAINLLRHQVRDSKHVATCLGFGPRFLHSTGQAYKGGPNTGVFLQITCDDARDVAIPGQTYTFGIVKAAQARGDFDVLTERQRRALRIHITGELEKGLATLQLALTEALS